MQLHARVSRGLESAIEAIKSQWHKLNQSEQILLRVKIPYRPKSSIIDAVLNASNDAILAIRPSGQVIYANNKLLDLFKLNSQSVLSLSVMDAFACFGESELKILKEALLLNQAYSKVELNGKDTFGRPRIYLVEICSTKVADATALICLTLKDISQNEVLRYENNFLKSHDLTTGMLNREAFLDKLQRSIGRARRYNTSCAVIFLGLDGFTAINHAYGHKQGDLVLREVAKRIQSVVRDTDVVARFGGDEFLVLLDRLDEPLKAGEIAEFIIHAIQQPFENSVEIDFISISAGIAVYPQDEHDPALLIQCARMGLLEAKQKGKNTYQYYYDNLQKGAQRKILVANELRKALRTNQLEVYFQPLLQTKTLNLLGIEALARWHHPKLGDISPNEFVAVAEEMGFISMLGRYIFTLSCQHFSNWTKQIELGYHFKLSINLSVKEFLKKDFVSFIVQTAKKYEIPPDCLQLEITESIFIEETDLIVKKLKELKAEGFEIVMDDFGTGYSCLSILSALPIDVLKIDKSFTEKLTSPNPSQQAIVRAIVDLAKNLKIKTIAEGVETIVQQSYMTKLGVDGVQGFLFAKPMNPKDMQTYLQNLDKQQKDTRA